VAEVITPFLFWLNNPAYQAQLTFIKEQNPGMTVDVTDLTKAILIPLCQTCGTDAGMCYHSRPSEEENVKPRQFYRCAICGKHGAGRDTKEEALQEWFLRNPPPPTN
jgi:hypothetical protein